jgi:hypothetical protein
MGVSRRQAQRLFAQLPGDLRREVAAGRGRPRAEIHCSAHPRLLASLSEPAAPASRLAGIAAADLAVASLRARAVAEYKARLFAGEPEGCACAATCAEWGRPRERAVEQAERIGRHLRATSELVRVGGFRPASLRRWAALYKEEGLAGLAPRRKGNSGRAEIELPEQLIQLIYAEACSTPRADIEKGIEAARRIWPGDFPAVSYATLRRRVRALDPERFGETLGKRGVAAFRRAHSPDLSRDYSTLSYNGEWQIDDVTADFYCHAGSDPLRLIRPFAYAIIRVATREWVGAVVSEAPINQAQVRSLIGLTMADPRGGIPEALRFERGAVACDDYLEEILTGLGVAVHRTSMDGGKVAPTAAADRGIGHPQGKAVIESNFRNLHNRTWDAAAQVGPEERHTAQQRLDTIKTEAQRLAREGKFLILPTLGKAAGMIFQALEDHNARPHSGLPEILDPETIKRRHMSPAEAAMQRASEPLRVMPQNLLPLFLTKGVAVPVTRNGITLNGGNYGRFDEALQAFAGQSVTVYADECLPHVVYIEQLARCVDLYIEGRGTMEAKRGIERRKRNQFEAAVAAAQEAGSNAMLDAVRTTREPVPNRVREIAECPALAARAESLAGARAAHAAEASRARARFNIEAGPARRAAGRRGIIAAAEEIEESLAYIGADRVFGNNPQETDHAHTLEP